MLHDSSIGWLPVSSLSWRCVVEPFAVLSPRCHTDLLEDSLEQQGLQQWVQLFAHVLNEGRETKLHSILQLPNGIGSIAGQLDDFQLVLLFHGLDPFVCLSLSNKHTHSQLHVCTYMTCRSLSQATAMQKQELSKCLVQARGQPGSHEHTCGSTMSGHLLALLMIKALSMLKLSLGKPSSIQARIVTGSPITFASLKWVLHGMPADLQTWQHVCWLSGRWTHRIHTSMHHMMKLRLHKLQCLPDPVLTAPL